MSKFNCYQRSSLWKVSIANNSKIFIMSIHAHNLGRGQTYEKMEGIPL